MRCHLTPTRMTATKRKKERKKNRTTKKNRKQQVWVRMRRSWNLRPAGWKLVQLLQKSMWKFHTIFSGTAVYGSQIKTRITIWPTHPASGRIGTKLKAGCCTAMFTAAWCAITKTGEGPLSIGGWMDKPSVAWTFKRSTGLWNLIQERQEKPSSRRLNNVGDSKSLKPRHPPCDHGVTCFETEGRVSVF